MSFILDVNIHSQVVNHRGNLPSHALLTQRLRDELILDVNIHEYLIEASAIPCIVDPKGFRDELILVVLWIGVSQMVVQRAMVSLCLKMG